MRNDADQPGQLKGNKQGEEVAKEGFGGLKNL